MAYANRTALPLPSRYQLPAVPVAPPGTFAEAVATLAGYALHAAQSEQDRQAMHDLRRKEGRYPYRPVDRALDLVAQLPEAQFEEALAQFTAQLRASLVKRRTRGAHAPDLTVALVLETEAQGECDNAQLAVVREVLATGAVTKDRVVKLTTAATRQMMGIRRFLDDLSAVPVRETAK